MRGIHGFLLIGSLAIAPACADRSPTAPEKSPAAADSISSPATDRASIIRTSRDQRSRGVVSARRDGSLPPGVWGSDQASVTIRSGSATVKIFGNGVPPEGCYGSYGDVPHGVPNGNFTLPGTFTQLTGVYPGRIDYPAQFTGSVEGSRMTISIQVPGESRLLGPYLLTAGVTNAWGPCLYP